MLFSAAQPGQGGTQHINEQPLEWWRAHFAARGYRAVDAVRLGIVADERVKPWYRYNVVLYLRGGPYLPAVDGPLPDVSPLPYRLRKRVLRRFPVWAIDAMARTKVRWLNARSGR